MSQDLTAFVTDLIRRMVRHPEAVEVRLLEGSPVLLELHVAPEDQGRIIGREGRTIRALRTLVSMAARKAGVRATLELAE
jgi:hypothetical protein